MNKSNSSLKIQIAMYGDISLNDEFVVRAEKGTLPKVFAGLKNINNKSDLIIANLESPLMGNGGENKLKSPRVKTSKKAIHEFLNLKVDVVILANNHIYDCLDDGFINTINFLRANNIRTIGTGRSPEEASQAIFINVKGKKICILAYVDKFTNPNLPKNSKIYLNWLDDNKVIANIKKYKRQADLIIVSIHWGVEFCNYPTLLQRKKARNFIEAGARIIFCHHAHRLQGYEIYENGYIFYGLGNTIFGDITTPPWNCKWTNKEKRGGIAICKLNIKKLDLDINGKILPIIQRGLNVHVDKDKKRFRKIKKLSKWLSLSDRYYKYYWIISYYLDMVHRYLFYQGKNPLTQMLKIRPRHILTILNYFNFNNKRTS